MRYQGIYITGLGAELGPQVPTPGMTRRGTLALADARRMRQRLVCVAGASASELAVRAARKAVRGHERDTGARPSIRAHLHASRSDKADFWSAACFVLDQLAATDHVTDCAVVCEIGAMSNGMSNGMVLGLELTASLVAGRPDLHTVLLSAGDRFSGYGADHGVHYGVLYGAAGAAMVVSRTPGWARLVSVATCSDTALDGLTRSMPPTTTSSTEAAGTRIYIRSRQRAWRSNGGPAEALRRNHLGVVTATAVALADAGIDLDQARWIVTPFLGREAKRTRWLRPLGIDPDHDDRTLTTLGMHLGHLGAADHVVGLQHLMATDAVDPGDHVVLASASERSAGRTWTTAVLQILAPHHIPDDPHDPGDPDVSPEPDDVSIEPAREHARQTHQGPAAA